MSSVDSVFYTHTDTHAHSKRERREYRREGKCKLKLISGTTGERNSSTAREKCMFLPAVNAKMPFTQMRKLKLIEIK